jgi:hypothetical protein
VQGRTRQAWEGSGRALQSSPFPYDSSQMAVLLCSLAFHCCHRARDDQLSGLRRLRRLLHSPGQDQLSDQIILSLHLSAQALPFGFLKRTNGEAAFCWPATVGAKMGGIRELKTAVQTIFDQRSSPHLSFPFPVLVSPSEETAGQAPSLFIRP